MHILVKAQSATLRPKGAQTPHNWHISPNCWQNISYTRIYPPIVGRIYPIPEYICQLLAEYFQYQNISPIVGRIYLIPEYIQYQYTYRSWLDFQPSGRNISSRPVGWRLKSTLVFGVTGPLRTLWLIYYTICSATCFEQLCSLSSSDLTRFPNWLACQVVSIPKLNISKYLNT